MSFQVDLDCLYYILEHQRGHKSPPEEKIIAELLVPLQSRGMKHDEFGNYWIDVPDVEQAVSSGVIWSCHTDTVHSQNQTGLQSIEIVNGMVSLTHRSKGESNCLGGDDGVGLWLMVEMIDAGVPGRYIFHRGEERGCVGSSWIRRNNADAMLSGFKACIALDRRDYNDVITHQRGRRTCSDQFANSLIDALDMSTFYKPCDTGLYTDSAVYEDTVPECTNLSVGYRGSHSAAETVDANFGCMLLNHLVKIDLSKLQFVRDPKAWRMERGAQYIVRDNKWWEWDDQKNMYMPGERPGSVVYIGSANGSKPLNIVPQKQLTLVDQHKNDRNKDSFFRKMVSFVNRHPKDVATLLIDGFEMEDEDLFLYYMKEVTHKTFVMDKRR